jgi:tRNA threonylcarbamoyladenosine biosynthesis protein TsaE
MTDWPVKSTVLSGRAEQSGAGNVALRDRARRIVPGGWGVDFPHRPGFMLPSAPIRIDMSGQLSAYAACRDRFHVDLRPTDPAPCPGPRQPLQTRPVSRPDHTAPIEIGLPDPAATRQLAERLAAVAVPRDVVALGGTLGMGKTAFARFFIQHLAGVEEVPSPTFTLVQTYDCPAGTIWHFDLYRLSRPEDVWELGFEDALAAGILLIEWPERLGALLPVRRLDLTLRPGAGPQARKALLDACGGSDLLDRLADR